MSGQLGVVGLGVAQGGGTVLDMSATYRAAGAGFAQHEKSIADALRAQS
jgi:hypothetical protein